MAPRPTPSFAPASCDPTTRSVSRPWSSYAHVSPRRAKSQRGAHLYNPFTHEFSSAVASASVTGPDLGVCDALATALSVGGHDVMVLIDKSDEYEAMTIDAEGAMRATPGFPFVRD